MSVEQMIQRFTVICLKCFVTFNKIRFLVKNVCTLKTIGADAIICGGIGGGAQMALAEAGIKLFGGVSGSCDEAVEALLAGKFGYDPNVKCDHHDHEHGGEGHTCGNHGCGSHKCH